MKKIFREIQQLLYKNQELLKDKIPLQEFMRLSRDYGQRGRRVPEFVMRKDLRNIKGYLML